MHQPEPHAHSVIVRSVSLVVVGFSHAVIFPAAVAGLVETLSVCRLFTSPPTQEDWSRRRSPKLPFLLRLSFGTGITSIFFFFSIVGKPSGFSYLEFTLGGSSLFTPSILFPTIITGPSGQAPLTGINVSPLPSICSLFRWFVIQSGH